MELAMDFATFCNICFKKENLRKIEKTENLLNVLMIFIENKIVISGEEIYLCLNCCEKLESYDKFKDMCLRNFIDFRVEYSELKKKLETANDPNMEEKLRNFIEIKIYGASETLKLEDSENIVKASNLISIQELEKNLTGKKDEGNDYNYNFHSVKCKTEKEEYEDIEEYKFHTEHDLENSENDFELPLSVEHIKVESYVEDIDATVSSSKNTLAKFIKSRKRLEAFHTSTELTHDDPASVSILNNAQSTNQESREIECKICKKSLANMRNLKVHMRIHTGEKPFTCTACNKSFNVSSNLKKHLVAHKVEKRYTCNLCNKTYSKLSTLKVHERVHTGEKPHVCHICNKAFSYFIGLKRHMLIHSDEKPYTCLTCNKTFKRLENLKGHERVHTGEKPYACSMCDKTFSNSGNLRKHELVHTGEKPYTCGVCQKSFSDPTTLKVHERLHTDEKPYECTVCNERFRQLYTYKVHKLTHTGEKPYTCNVCKKAFRQLSTLRAHERLHTGVKPYICEICKNAFRRRSELRSHKQKPCVPELVQDEITEKSEET